MTDHLTESQRKIMASLADPAAKAKQEKGMFFSL